jgi:hypothetical protein
VIKAAVLTDNNDHMLDWCGRLWIGAMCGQSGYHCDQGDGIQSSSAAALTPADNTQWHLSPKD